MLSHGKEDYIKVIAELLNETDYASLKSIADFMGVSSAAVSDMVNKLAKESLVTIRPYKGIQLTEAGRDYNSKLNDRHRLWEVFLVNCLGYSLREAHEDAHILEHYSPQRLIDRLNTFMEMPKYCPHGHDIEANKETEEDLLLLTLNKLKVGESAKLVSFKEEGAFLDHVEEKQLKPGLKILITKKEAFGGSIVLRFDEQEVSIGMQAAEMIKVKRIKDNYEDSTI
jgi:DtxR family Mn-dependent transcriptional regulator